MRLFLICLTVAGASAGLAHAQAVTDPALERPRVAAPASSLTDQLADVGAPHAWRDGDTPAFKLRWKGKDTNWDVSAASRFVEETEANARDFQKQGLFEGQGAVVRRVGGAWTAPVIDADPDSPRPRLVTGYVAGPALHEAVGAAAADRAAVLARNVPGARMSTTGSEQDTVTLVLGQSFQALGPAPSTTPTTGC